MNSTIYIDIGSRTTKIFLAENGKLKHLRSIAVDFAEGYTKQFGIADTKKNSLFRLVRSLQKNYPLSRIRAVATALFRKLSRAQQQAIISQFLSITGFRLRIISQNLENRYLAKALVRRCFINQTVLLINIGGESTELVIVKNRKALKYINVDFGIGEVNKRFPNINSTDSSHVLTSVTAFVKDRLPTIGSRIFLAFNAGSELLYTKLLRYPLLQNTIFHDEDHPFVMKVKDYAAKNAKIYESVSLRDLETLMPSNPRRMHGARAASAIAQAICEKYQAQFIVPSDVDIAHGIFQEDLESGAYEL